MKIINIINIPNYPNYSIHGKEWGLLKVHASDSHGKEWGLLKVHVSDLLPDDEIEYNGEDRCISIDFTKILDITFDLYDNDVSGIYNYRIIINEESLGLVEITFDNYSHFNSMKIAISNMINDDVNLTAIHEQKERIRINKK